MTRARLSKPLVIALILVVLLIWRAAEAGGGRMALAALIGLGAGLSLYHASFGFTAGWRRIVSEARGTGLRAQFLLIGLTALVSYPLIATGYANGWVQPMSVGMVFGAFMFGMGMQLGGGCGSGTLFVVGGGSTRMVITLTFFVIGSVIGVAHLPFWRETPSLGRVSLISEFGMVGAYASLIAILGLLALWSVWRERSVHGEIEPARKTGSLITGPWSPWAGAVALALVGIATFLVLHRPWGITQAFGFWGAKAMWNLGVPTDSWILERWSVGTLERSLFSNATSVMDFGIMIGAMGAASLAGKFAPIWRLSLTDISTAVIGGLLMGYGARLAYGCNIGGYLGGLASGSLHGWLWAAAAFAGSSLIVWWRMPGAPTPQKVPS